MSTLVLKLCILFALEKLAWLWDFKSFQFPETLQYHFSCGKFWIWSCIFWIDKVCRLHDILFWESEFPLKFSIPWKIETTENTSVSCIVNGLFSLSTWKFWTDCYRQISYKFYNQNLTNCMFFSPSQLYLWTFQDTADLWMYLVLCWIYV